MEELGRLGAKNIVLSTNIKVRRDGLPYASQRPPEDPAVAVYFTYKGTQRAFCCDLWLSVGDNIQSIAKTIEALRGIERWGSSDMMDRAFTGFDALPAPSLGPPWREVLGLSEDETDPRRIMDAYQVSRMKAHPDKGGSNEAFHRVEQAYKDAQIEGYFVRGKQ